MQQQLACLAAISLLLSGCAADEKLPPLAPLPPLIRAPAAAPPEATSDRPDWVVAPPESPSRLSTVSPLPPRPPLYQLPPPAVSAPVGASPNLGPVTGYGPGGMGTIPGSPANPPYH